MTGFELAPRGPFSLDDAAQFLGGFVPASGGSERLGTALVLVFRLDGSYEPVGVSLQRTGDRLSGEIAGSAASDAVARQVARILSLDVDGTGWPDVGRRDPAMARLQLRFPGARPVCFPSPYEAAAWGILAQRVPMRQAARLKLAIAEHCGDVVRVGDRRFPIFPAPRQVLAMASHPGLPAEKLQRLKAVAEAALDGQLDPERLRSMPEAEALERLERIRGVGAWTAQHILMRGAGLADALPTAEPRVLRGTALAYGLPQPPDAAEFAKLADAWRPYRMWATLLLVRALSNTPGWHGPEKRGARVVRSTSKRRRPRGSAS